jgi:hypothetical protein
MNLPAVGRVVSVLAGAAVLFGLDQWVGVSLYVAIPAAILVYVVLRVAFAALAEANARE